MNFSRLPDNAFLKILEYLELEDLIRIGRVNKTFRGIGQLAISRTKYLNLGEVRFRNLTPDQLADILDLCSSNLKQIIIGGNQDRLEQLATTFAQYFFFLDQDPFLPVTGVSTGSNSTGAGCRDTRRSFAQYECPRMTDIDLGYTPIDGAVFQQMIGNCRNLENLVWHKEFVGFPAMTNNKLKKLRLYVFTDASLQTMVGHCPNLEEIYLSAGNEITARVLDQFFASIPHAHRIIMAGIKLEEAEFINFYKLPLTQLRIRNFAITNEDVLLSKVATSFPHLQELQILLLKPTNQGIGRLAALQDLQVLQLAMVDYGEPYSQGFWQLAYCKKLRKLYVSLSDMTGGTLVNLLRSCPQLEYVRIYDMTEVDSPDEAAVILESLAGIAKRDITINFDRNGKTFQSIWKREPVVKAANKKLEENDGVRIKIEKD